MSPHLPENLFRGGSAGEVHGVHLVERHEMVVSTATESLQAFDDLVVRQAVTENLLDLLAEAPELPAPPDRAFSDLREDPVVNRKRDFHTVSGINV